MSIKDFLAKNPSLLEILEFAEKEARRIASERKAKGEAATVSKLQNEK